MTIQSIPEEFVDAWIRTGSSVICNPPVLTTDEDYVILANDPEEAKTALEDDGWDCCGETKKYGGDGSTFVAYRKGKLNYILVEDPAIFDQWEAATLLATKRNLLDKNDRIKLFKNIVKKSKHQHGDW